MGRVGVLLAELRLGEVRYSAHPIPLALSSACSQRGFEHAYAMRSMDVRPLNVSFWQVR